MKAITLDQPWASAIALGLKTIETRGWATRHRGPIAIHAGVRKTGWYNVEAFDLLCAEVPGAQDTFARVGIREFDHMPRGAVVAIADLVDCKPVELLLTQGVVTEGLSDWWWGNYECGCNRWGWRLANVRSLAQPIPAKGMQRVWEWAAPDFDFDTVPVNPPLCP